MLALGLTAAHLVVLRSATLDFLSVPLAGASIVLAPFVTFTALNRAYGLRALRGLGAAGQSAWMTMLLTFAAGLAVVQFQLPKRMARLEVAASGADYEPSAGSRFVRFAALDLDQGRCVTASGWEKRRKSEGFSARLLCPIAPDPNAVWLLSVHERWLPRWRSDPALRQAAESEVMAQMERMRRTPAVDWAPYYERLPLGLTRRRARAVLADSGFGSASSAPVLLAHHRPWTPHENDRGATVPVVCLGLFVASTAVLARRRKP